jgi:hypothetical protein
LAAEILDLGGAHGARLHEAEVAEEEDAGGALADFEGPGGLRADVHGALAAEADREAELVGERGEVLVDGGGFGGAACHRGDDHGGAEGLAEQVDRGVDLSACSSGRALWTSCTCSSKVLLSRKPTLSPAQRAR